MCTRFSFFFAIVFVATITLHCGPGASDPESTPNESETTCKTISSSEDLNGDRQLDHECYELSGALLLDHGEVSIAADTTIYVDSVLTLRTTLNVGPGTVFIFGNDAGLDVDGGVLRAIGEEGQSIRFIGNHEVSGHWKGLRFANTPAPSFNRLEKVEVSHAASRTWDSTSSVTRANIFVDQGGRLEVNGLRVNDSSHHGISVTGGQVSGCTDVTFSNIARHHVYRDDDGQTCF